jgi:CDP-diacylglycerol--serine O-phosphatidyltransferase
VTETASTRLARYLVPNVITMTSLVFGMLSLAASQRGDFESAAWWVIYAVLFDRLDGLSARLLRATSELGIHLDSFADFLGFGVAPAFLMLTFLGHHPLLPFGDGVGRILLFAACVAWALAAAFRLARYNITADTAMPTKVFFGIPTTLAGGTLMVWFLAFYKYAGPGETFGGAKLLGDGLQTPVGVWWYFPIAMGTGAYLMVSSMPLPKVGLAESKGVTVFVLANLLAGYVLGFARMFPEYLVLPPSLWIVVFLIWGQASPTARAMRPGPVFPRVPSDS